MNAVFHIAHFSLLQEHTWRVICLTSLCVAQIWQLHPRKEGLCKFSLSRSWWLPTSTICSQTFERSPCLCPRFDPNWQVLSKPRTSRNECVSSMLPSIPRAFSWMMRTATMQKVVKIKCNNVNPLTVVKPDWSAWTDSFDPFEMVLTLNGQNCHSFDPRWMLLTPVWIWWHKTCDVLPLFNVHYKHNCKWIKPLMKNANRHNHFFRCRHQSTCVVGSSCMFQKLCFSHMET